MSYLCTSVKKSTVLKIFICFFSGLQGVSLSDQELVTKYTAPQSIRDALSSDTNFLLNVVQNCSQKEFRKRRRHLVWRLDSLPGYFIKWDVSRIRGLETIRSCIEKHNLFSLDVPTKYLYHIPGRPETFDNMNYVVIAQIQKAITLPLVIDEEEAQQITTLISQTGYYEFTEKNILRTAPYKITIIDTESRFKKPSFGLFKLLARYGLFNLNTQFTQAALEHIFNEYFESVPVYDHSYPERYDQILKNLEKQIKTASWDYVSFFMQMFPEPHR